MLLFLSLPFLHVSSVAKKNEEEIGALRHSTLLEMRISIAIGRLFPKN